MPDPFDLPTRSRIMSRIRSKGNRSTERRFRASLASNGVRGWKMHLPGVEGSPDIVFPERRVAVFLDGCFWHGCPTCYTPPASNRAYWSAKLLRNRERRRTVAKLLRAQGFRVVELWEHELRQDMGACVAKVTNPGGPNPGAGPSLLYSPSRAP